VRGGGHNTPGIAVCEGGLMILGKRLCECRRKDHAL
jgi:hypothetical protein